MYAWQALVLVCNRPIVFAVGRESGSRLVPTCYRHGPTLALVPPSSLRRMNSIQPRECLGRPKTAVSAAQNLADPSNRTGYLGFAMPALKKILLEKLNQQIANELHASHLYLAMAAYFDAQDYPGMAAWMRVHAEEEREHAMKFYQHIDHRGGQVELHAIEKPPAKFKGPSDVFEQALKHEREVTKQIHELYEAARDEKDYALQVFLNWFVEEQAEEEDLFATTLAKVKRVESEATGLMLMDQELGSRTPGES